MVKSKTRFHSNRTSCWPTDCDDQILSIPFSDKAATLTNSTKLSETAEDQLDPQYLNPPGVGV